MAKANQAYQKRDLHSDVTARCSKAQAAADFLRSLALADQQNVAA
jgi:hypothetical protein